MNYAAILWPRAEERRLASTRSLTVDGETFATPELARAAAQSMLRDAGEQAAATLSAYVVKMRGRTIAGLERLADLPSRRAEYLPDLGVVRVSGVGEAQAARLVAQGGIATEPGVVDFPAADERDGRELALHLEAWTTGSEGAREPNGKAGELEEAIVDLLDRIRGKRARHEAAKEVRAALPRVAPEPAKELKLKEARAAKAKATREAVQKASLELLSRPNSGEAVAELAEDLEEGKAELAELRKKAKKAEGAEAEKLRAERDALAEAVKHQGRVLRAATKRLEDCEEICAARKKEPCEEHTTPVITTAEPSPSACAPPSVPASEASAQPATDSETNQHPRAMESVAACADKPSFGEVERIIKRKLAELEARLGISEAAE